MADVTPAQAVAHPNWDMGAKISVDSATMMNKGLELIEAFHLFPVAAGQIEIVVHPQSVIHSLVAYVDGSVLAQLGAARHAHADRLCARLAATAWRRRRRGCDLAEIGQLTFEAPDEREFPALRLAREALRRRRRRADRPQRRQRGGGRQLPRGADRLPGYSRASSKQTMAAGSDRSALRDRRRHRGRPGSACSGRAASFGRFRVRRATHVLPHC